MTTIYKNGSEHGLKGYSDNEKYSDITFKKCGIPTHFFKIKNRPEIVVSGLKEITKNLSKNTRMEFNISVLAQLTDILNQNMRRFLNTSLTDRKNVSEAIYSGNGEIFSECYFEKYKPELSRSGIKNESTIYHPILVGKSSNLSDIEDLLKEEIHRVCEKIDCLQNIDISAEKKQEKTLGCQEMKNPGLGSPGFNEIFNDSHESAKKGTYNNLNLADMQNFQKGKSIFLSENILYQEKHTETPDLFNISFEMKKPELSDSGFNNIFKDSTESAKNGEPDTTNLADMQNFQKGESISMSETIFSDENQGYLTIPRSLFNDPRFKAAPLKYQKVLMTILANVAWSRTKFSIGSFLIEILPGQMCTTERELMELCNDKVKIKDEKIDKNIVRRSLIFWEKNQLVNREVRQEVNQNKTIITVTIPGFYVKNKPLSEPASEPGCEPASEPKMNPESITVTNTDVYVKNNHLIAPEIKPKSEYIVNHTSEPAFCEKVNQQVNQVFISRNDQQVNQDVNQQIDHKRTIKEEYILVNPYEDKNYIFVNSNTQIGKSRSGSNSKERIFFDWQEKKLKGIEPEDLEKWQLTYKNVDVKEFLKFIETDIGLRPTKYRKRKKIELTINYYFKNKNENEEAKKRSQNNSYKKPNVEEEKRKREEEYKKKLEYAKNNKSWSSINV